MNEIKTQRADVYDRVTAKIIEFLEAGAPLCERLWIGGPPSIPLRVNNKAYRGINQLVLFVGAIENGYGLGHWLTYKSAKGLGGQVRKGEKGELVVYADSFIKPVENKNTGETEDRELWFLKGYTVFNAQQIDGLPAAFYQRPTIKLMEKPEKLEAVKRFVANTGAKIIDGGTQAFYRPSTDEIHMPDYERFTSREAWHSVELHELGHWCAHSSRLNQPLGGDKRSKAYGIEELNAEITSAFLCASLEITPEVRTDHSAYLAAWLGILREDNRAIFAAAREAQRRTDYLFGLQPGRPQEDGGGSDAPDDPA
jgi:antirestriction protein ArdC